MFLNNIVKNANNHFGDQSIKNNKVKLQKSNKQLYLNSINTFL